MIIIFPNEPCKTHILAGDCVTQIFRSTFNI